ncbi:MAG: GNAT family N-acetyltransferase [Acidimicrobiales bacterium]
MPDPGAEPLPAPAEPSYTTRPLDASTWDAFADLVERNNGIYGGCWCIAFHTDYRRGASDPRTLKHELVHAGRAHAALVFDEDGRAQGWCQYGSPDELNLKHARAYRADPPPPAHWRIACIFVDKAHRGQGIARVALRGALGQIAAAGGGLTEAISETTVGRQAQGRFLFSATVELLEHHGFTRRRQVGKHAWIVSRLVDPAPISARRHTIDLSQRGTT